MSVSSPRSSGGLASVASLTAVLAVVCPSAHAAEEPAVVASSAPSPPDGCWWSRFGFAWDRGWRAGIAHGPEHDILVVHSDEQTASVVLGGRAVSRPEPAGSQLLVTRADGALVVVSLATPIGVRSILEGVIPAVLDPWELRNGLFLAALGPLAVVGSEASQLALVELASGSTELHRLGAPLVPGRVRTASGRGVWALTAAGELVHASKDGVVERVAASGEPAAVGPVPLAGAPRPTLAWGAVAGGVWTWDGSELQRLGTCPDRLVWPPVPTAVGGAAWVGARGRVCIAGGAQPAALSVLAESGAVPVGSPMLHDSGGVVWIAVSDLQGQALVLPLPAAPPELRQSAVFLSGPDWVTQAGQQQPVATTLEHAGRAASDAPRLAVELQGARARPGIPVFAAAPPSPAPATFAEAPPTLASVPPPANPHLLWVGALALLGSCAATAGLAHRRSARRPGRRPAVAKGRRPHYR